jgi:hypothetical protein
VPDKRGNRKLDVLGLDLSGNPTYRDLSQVNDSAQCSYQVSVSGSRAV